MDSVLEVEGIRDEELGAALRAKHQREIARLLRDPKRRKLLAQLQARAGLMRLGHWPLGTIPSRFGETRNLMRQVAEVLAGQLKPAKEGSDSVCHSCESRNPEGSLPRQKNPATVQAAAGVGGTDEPMDPQTLVRTIEGLEGKPYSLTRIPQLLGLAITMAQTDPRYRSKLILDALFAFRRGAYLRYSSKYATKPEALKTHIYGILGIDEGGFIRNLTAEEVVRLYQLILRAHRSIGQNRFLNFLAYAAQTADDLREILSLCAWLENLTELEQKRFYLHLDLHTLRKSASRPTVANLFIALDDETTKSTLTMDGLRETRRNFEQAKGSQSLQDRLVNLFQGEGQPLLARIGIPIIREYLETATDERRLALIDMAILTLGWKEVMGKPDAEDPSQALVDDLGFFLDKMIAGGNPRFEVSEPQRFDIQNWLNFIQSGVW